MDVLHSSMLATLKATVPGMVANPRGLSQPRQQWSKGASTDS